MRSSSKNLILWSLLALTSEVIAQTPYTLLKFGEANPYTLAVAVEISQYRLETKKLKLADQVIDSLTNEVKALHEQTEIAARSISDQEYTIELQSQSIKKNDDNFKELNENYKNLYKLATQPQKGVKLPTVLIVGSVCLNVGLIIGLWATR
jgi:hypothetical protein